MVGGFIYSVFIAYNRLRIRIRSRVFVNTFCVLSTGEFEPQRQTILLFEVSVDFEW